ncbi:unnamed protein product [Gongylonema pulchrum]|uniref:Secreted protein n=1 Tax=Gongylonema pulchrum TaxID=637853 RepID=A0A183DA21_9BILA|nr:unnamed protein product [Gongylonema pulchrum]
MMKQQLIKATEDIAVAVPALASNLSASAPCIRDGEMDSVSDATSLPMDPTK